MSKLIEDKDKEKIFCPFTLIHLDIPALSMAPLMATEPSLVAGTAARLPLKEPIGVRTALTMTTSYNHELNVHTHYMVQFKHIVVIRI